jgi:hypothetical protein
MTTRQLEELRNRRDEAKSKAETRSHNTVTRRIAILALVVSVVSAAVAGSGVYLSNFYKPEDLVVDAHLVERFQLGSGKVDLSIEFTNLGKQSVAIENVFLVLCFGANATLEDCKNWKTEGQVWLREVRAHPDGTPVRMQDGVELSVYSPKAVRLNNSNSNPSRATFLAPTDAVTLLLASFEPQPIDIEVNAIVPMIAIELYGKQGVRRRYLICLGIEGHPPGLYNPSPESHSQLLPYVQSN